MTFLAVLASSASNSTSTLNDVEPGLLGFLVVAGLGVALFFLLRSMNKQFKKIGPRPENAEEAAADRSQPGDATGAEAPGAATGAEANRG